MSLPVGVWQSVRIVGAQDGKLLQLQVEAPTPGYGPSLWAIIDSCLLQLANSDICN